MGETGERRAAGGDERNTALRSIPALDDLGFTRPRAARWQLGGLLEKMERGKAPGKGKMISQPGKSFLDYIKSIGLDKNRAQEAQRIHKLPKPELEKALKANAKQEVLTSYAGLVKTARPYWFKAARKAKHEKIGATAKATKWLEREFGWTEMTATRFMNVAKMPLNETGSLRQAAGQCPAGAWSGARVRLARARGVFSR